MPTKFVCSENESEYENEYGEEKKLSLCLQMSLQVFSNYTWAILQTKFPILCSAVVMKWMNDQCLD